MDNIFLAQDLMKSYIHKRSMPRCAFKIDLCKAYNSISWAFLRQVLIGLIFSLYLLIRSYNVCHPRHFVLPSIVGPWFYCGAAWSKIRRSYVISSLFILRMDYFSRLLEVRTTNSDFNYHTKCSKCKITYLAFSEDLMLFRREDFPSTMVFAVASKRFSATSVLEISKEKSQIFIGGIHGVELDMIVKLFNFQMDELPVRYLGVPLTSKRLNLTDYFPLY